MLWVKTFSRDISGWGVSVFSPANDGAQVMLGVDKTKWLDGIQTGENDLCGHGGEEKEI